MKEYAVVFSPEAEEQLAELYKYVAAAASPHAAERYISAIIDYCVTIGRLPHQGTRRDDINPGLCITNFKGNAVIVFGVNENDLVVTIVGVFYGGRDYSAVLRR